MRLGVKFECLSCALPRNSHQLSGVSQFINNAGLQGLCCGKVVREINGLIQLLGCQTLAQHANGEVRHCHPDGHFVSGKF